jgi:hypothetical protein
MRAAHLREAIRWWWPPFFAIVRPATVRWNDFGLDPRKLRLIRISWIVRHRRYRFGFLTSHYVTTLELVTSGAYLRQRVTVRA